MKINGSNSSIQFDAYAQKTRDKTEASSRETGGDSHVQGADKVVLSPRAREIQEATQRLSTIPDVDDQRVEAVRNRIDEGGYRIEGKQIAEKMLNEMMRASALLSE